MTVGENSFTYTDKSSGERKVGSSHEWVERSTSKPPEAPGGDLSARWRPGRGHGLRVPLERAEGPRRRRITDYRFMLANRQDMRWPVDELRQADFADADKGKAPWLPRLPAADGGKTLLARAGQDQRAFGGRGARPSPLRRRRRITRWRARGYDKDKGIGTLTWKANPAGQSR